MNKIYYFCHYGNSKDRRSAPSANAKVDYIVECLESLGYNIEIVSFSESNDRSKIFKIYNEYTAQKGKTKIHYFKTYTSKFRIIRIIGRMFTQLEQKKYIKMHCLGNNSKILIYHSLAFFKIYKLLNKYKQKYILEVEEIYSDVTNKNKLRKKEIEYIQKANKYIFITELLNKEINTQKKEYIIYHGTYKNEDYKGLLNFDKKKIHCVYAGTFDQRKGGVMAAINTAKYLPNNYQIHILGFGLPKEIEAVKNEIEKSNKVSKAKIVYYGLLTGDDYIKHIQNCDIGLSTQNPNATFNATSFPSKILSYMSNGLRVVSIRIEAIETSKVGKYIYYYDNYDPKEIAKAIISIDKTSNYDSKKIIADLDNRFKKDLINLMEV